VSNIWNRFGSLRAANPRKWVNKEHVCDSNGMSNWDLNLVLVTLATESVVSNLTLSQRGYGCESISCGSRPSTNERKYRDEHIDC